MGSDGGAPGCHDVTTLDKVERGATLVSGMTAPVLAWSIPTTASAQQPVAAATSLVLDGVTVIYVEDGKLVPELRVVISTLSPGSC